MGFGWIGKKTENDCGVFVLVLESVRAAGEYWRDHSKSAGADRAGTNRAREGTLSVRARPKGIVRNRGFAGGTGRSKDT